MYIGVGFLKMKYEVFIWGPIIPTFKNVLYDSTKKWGFLKYENINITININIKKNIFQKQLFRVCVLRWVHGEPDGGQGDPGQGRQIHQVSHKLISNVNNINYINQII